MKIANKKSGFTLLEIIIVIIIVGVLASLALPRLFQSIEYSRSMEAMQTLAIAKRGAEACSMMGGLGIDYTGCDNFDGMGMANPGIPANSNFCYDVTPIAAGTFTIVATRSDIANGGGPACAADGTPSAAGSDTIVFTITTADGSLTKSGTGIFANVK